jgi:NADPH2:quinone reductase
MRLYVNVAEHLQHADRDDRAGRAGHADDDATRVFQHGSSIAYNRRLTMKAIRLHQFGGPEALKYEDVPDPVAKPGEALVKIEAAVVNFIDTYQRSGAYKIPLPSIVGQEGAGTIVGVAPGVTAVKPGDKVAWTGVAGSYAEKIAVPVDRLVALAPGATTKQGAAMMLQGMTAQYLACSTYPLKPGDTCLVHAGAGGVGLLLTQIAKIRGARVITTVSTDEKAKLSREAGADDVVLYTRQDFEEAVKEITGGKKVPVVYDSVGKTTFDKSLNCLAPRGMMVLFGQSSGAVPPVDLQILAQKGSLFVTRPTLANYIASRGDLEQRASDIFGWIAAGKLRLRMEFEFPLKDATQAHTALEGRKTTGKVLLIP